LNQGDTRLEPDVQHVQRRQLAALEQVDVENRVETGKHLERTRQAVSAR